MAPPSREAVNAAKAFLNHVGTHEAMPEGISLEDVKTHIEVYGIHIHTLIGHVGMERNATTRENAMYIITPGELPTIKAGLERVVAMYVGLIQSPDTPSDVKYRSVCVAFAAKGCSTILDTVHEMFSFEESDN